MKKKSERSGRASHDPDDAPEITQEWIDGANLYRGKKLIRRGAGGLVRLLASMPNVGEDTDFARDQTGRSALIGRGRMIMAKIKFAPFNAAQYLDNDDVIVAYLTAALDDPDPAAFTMALSNVAEARGIAKVAKDSGLGRRVVQKAFAPGAQPSFETVHKLVNALGVCWTVVAPTSPEPPCSSRAPGAPSGRRDAYHCSGRSAA